MPIIDEQLAAFPGSYFDSIRNDSIEKSPYPSSANRPNVDELVSSSNDIIDAGRSERLDISANSRHSIEKITVSVAKCRSTDGESKLRENPHQSVVGCVSPQMLDETRCYILVTLSTVLGDQRPVIDLKKTCRELIDWSRQKLRRDWRNEVQTQEDHLKRESPKIREADPVYRSDIDIIDAIENVPKPVRDSIDEETSAIDGGGGIRNIRRIKDSVGSQPKLHKLSVRPKW